MKLAFHVPATHAIFVFLCSIREGTVSDFLARSLVPRDIVSVSVGDRVPADMRLVEVDKICNGL